MGLSEKYKACIYEVKIEEVVYPLKFNGVNPQFVAQAIAEFKIENFGIITAYNPRSVIASENENRKKNFALLKKLRELKVDYFYGENKDPSNEWPIEISYFIWPCSKEILLSLCEEFDQNAAVLGNKNGELELILNSP